MARRGSKSKGSSSRGGSPGSTRAGTPRTTSTTKRRALGKMAPLAIRPARKAGALDFLLSQPRKKRTVPRPLKVPPRQRRLLTEQRPETRRALAALGTSTGAGRKRRERISEGLPEALRAAICADRKTRREMVFATNKQGRSAGKRPKQLTLLSKVKC